MSIKQFFKNSLPLPSKIKSHPKLKFFGNLLHEPNLWHLNRRSLSGGMAVGLFVAFIPLPIQMLLAVAAAVWLKVNLPLSVSLVWITNPVTMPPLFYFAYQLGALILGIPIIETEFSFSPEWLLYTLGNLLQPLLLGCLVLGIVSAAIGYLAVNFLWRLQVIKLRKERRNRKLSNHKS
ncbi:DUF2062 domain-containing protein [Thiotrichales bacterium HSG1]|nr:DUF2062 domain-containing protein [Thiotrichales bacterium HSG1]